MRTNETNFWFWLVRLLPNKVIYFCFMHVMAYSTTGKYSSTIAPNLTGMDAIKRFGDDKEVRSNRLRDL